MKKSLIILIYFFSFSVASAETHLWEKIYINGEYLKDNKFSFGNELGRLDKLFPKKFISELPTVVVMAMPNTKRDSLSIFDLCRVAGDDHILAKYDSKQKYILLHQSLLQALLRGDNGLIADCAPHKTLYKTAQAAFVHELMHAYEENNKMSLSTNNRYLLLSNYELGREGNYINRNIEGDRLPDNYEKVSPIEHLAINFEFFILDETYSCRRPSIYNYFKRAFNFLPRKNCNKQTKVYLEAGDNIQMYDLKYENVKRIDYVLAARGEGIVSGAGHSLFRLVLCAEKEDNYVGPLGMNLNSDCSSDEHRHLYLSFAANVDDYSLDYLKGLLGGYPSILSLLSYSSVKTEYLETSLRNLEIYPLKLTEEQRNQFVDLTLERFWQYTGDYKFLKNNCATESHYLLRLVLSESGIKIKGSFIERPYGLLEKLEKNKLIETENAYVLQNKEDLFKRALINLHGDKFDFYDYIKMPALKRRELYVTSSRFKSVKEEMSYKALESMILRRKTAEVVSEIYKRMVNEEPLNMKYGSLELSSLSFKGHVEAGYGIPLVEEAVFDFNKYQKSKETANKFVLENFEYFPDLASEIKTTDENIRILKQQESFLNYSLE